MSSQTQGCGLGAPMLVTPCYKLMVYKYQITRDYVPPTSQLPRQRKRENKSIPLRHAVLSVVSTDEHIQRDFQP